MAVNTNEEDHSLRRRYFAKISANLVALATNIITQLIVPRTLGPTLFGNFSFLTDYFYKLFNFVDFGFSSALFTKLSQRPKDSGLLKLYLIYFFIILISIFTFVGLTGALGFTEFFWPEQNISYVMAGALWGSLTFFMLVTNQVMDAYGLTTKSEKLRIFHRLATLVFLIILVVFNWLNLTSLFLFHFFSLGTLILGWWVIAAYKKNEFISFSKESLFRKDFLIYFKEFWTYCRPLIAYTVVGGFCGIGERWLLQKFAGASQQGYYGLSYQIASASFLFVAGMTPLLWREFSIAFGENNLPRAKALLERYLPSLGSLMTFFCVFLATQAGNLCLIVGGTRFMDAKITTAIMVLYPIHQTYGQIVGTVFLSSGKTRLYRNLGNFFAILGLIVTYFLVASTDYWGLGLGAAGLAIKMVVFNVVQSNINLWFSAKYVNTQFHYFLRPQILSALFLTSIALLATWLSSQLLLSPLLIFIFSGMIYSLMALLSLFYIPSLYFIDSTQAKKELLLNLMEFLKRFKLKQ